MGTGGSGDPPCKTSTPPSPAATFHTCSVILLRLKLNHLRDFGERDMYVSSVSPVGAWGEKLSRNEHAVDEFHELRSFQNRDASAAFSRIGWVYNDHIALEVQLVGHRRRPLLVVSPFPTRWA